MIRTRSPLKARLLQMPEPVAQRVIEIEYFRLLLPPFKQWALKQFKKATQHINPQAIIVHKPIDLLFMRLTYPDKPIIGVIHSFSSKYLHHADVIFAVSESLKAHIVESGVQTPVVVINNSTPMVPLNEPKRRAVLVIGTMAVFRKTKRLDILLQAFRELKKQQVPFKGIIAGAGLLRPYLKFLIWRWNLQEQVELRPWVTDKEAFYSDVDVFAVTSKKETFNICLIESMARKKPVISTSCGGPTEIIEHNVDGILTEVNNVPDLVDNLRILIEDSALRDRLAENGFQKVQQKYQRSVVQAKMIDQVQQLAASKHIDQ